MKQSILHRSRRAADAYSLPGQGRDLRCAARLLRRVDKASCRGLVSVRAEIRAGARQSCDRTRITSRVSGIDRPFAPRRAFEARWSTAPVQPAHVRCER